MSGNRICRQIKWYENQEQVEAWRNGKTGFPWIDANMRQMVSQENININLKNTFRSKRDSCATLVVFPSLHF